MHGPNGFAQPHLAPDWWREKHGLLSLDNPKITRPTGPQKETHHDPRHLQQ
jgi:hypothetical protein